jgi:hypothetical protein
VWMARFGGAGRDQVGIKKEKLGMSRPIMTNDDASTAKHPRAWAGQCGESWISHSSRAMA